MLFVVVTVADQALGGDLGAAHRVADLVAEAGQLHGVSGRSFNEASAAQRHHGGRLSDRAHLGFALDGL